MSASSDLLNKHFIKRDGYYDMTAAASFVMLAGYAYDPNEEPAPGMRAHVDEILARAARAGFGRSDIFTTMLATSGVSERALRLACEVTAAVGGDAAMFKLIYAFKQQGEAQ